MHGQPHIRVSLILFTLDLPVILRKYFVTADSQTVTLSQILVIFIIYLHTEIFVRRWKENILNSKLSWFYFPLLFLLPAL